MKSAVPLCVAQSLREHLAYCLNLSSLKQPAAACCNKFPHRMTSGFERDNSSRSMRLAGQKKPPPTGAVYEIFLLVSYLTLAILLAGFFLNLPAQLLQQKPTE